MLGLWQDNEAIRARHLAGVGPKVPAGRMNNMRENMKKTTFDYPREELSARRLSLFDAAQRWQDRARWEESMGRYYDTGHKGAADRRSNCDEPDRDVT